MEFFGKIYYTMDKRHPDWDHVIGKNSTSRVHTFDDIYRLKK